MNKNTKQIRVNIRKAGKQGEDTYKSKDGRVFSTSRLKGETVSTNRRRNMAMRAYHNTDDKGIKTSITVHEPMTQGEYVKFKNHSNYKDFTYRQPNSVQVSSKPVFA